MSSSFADLGVPPALVASLAARRIDAPFPIQAATIPDALEGRDICGRAPTGSGKTIAFGIPMIVELSSGTSRAKRPRGLVLVPTRELASQVCEELQNLAKPKGPWVEAFYGGVGFEKQVRSLQRGVDVVVACPGRLKDLIEKKICNLEDVEFVVIDEADRMADMGFLPDVRELLDLCSDDRQTLLFSATLDGDVDVLIKKYQNDPARHEQFDEDEGGIQADHYFWKVDRMDRLKAATSCVKRLGPTVVFCRTKRGAERIAKQMNDLGVRAAAIHGDRSQKQREEALRMFHQGKVQALVATDVAARGIHVDGVEGVIHYDPPADPKDYVHRSGRTARAGAKGVVISLVAPELRKAVAAIQKDLGYPVGLEPLNLEILGDELFVARTRSASSSKPAYASTSSSTSRSKSSSSSVSPRDRALADPEVKPTTADRPRSTRSDREDRKDRKDREDRGVTTERSKSTSKSTPSASDRRSAERAAAHRATRAERPETTERRDRPDRVQVEGVERADSFRTERPTRPADRSTGKPSRSKSHDPKAYVPPLRGQAEREPLAEGQRRPSGAARRKAKRLAAAEAVLMGVDVNEDGWTTADLFDGESLRTERPAPKSKSKSKRPAPAARKSGTKKGRAKPVAGGKTAGPKRGAAATAKPKAKTRTSTAPAAKARGGKGTGKKAAGARR